MLRSSAQKVRLVIADLIRGKKVSQLDILTYTNNKKSGCTGQESSESAIANAEHKRWR